MTSPNPNLVSQICVMQEQERERAYRPSDYMKQTDALSPDDRMALCDWAFKVVEACNGVSRVTAVKAFSYFDRFVSTPSKAAAVARSDTAVSQLALVTCLVIALKIHSGFNVESDFVSNVICRDMYDAEQINEMELIILRDLGWRLNGPIPHDFIDHFLEIIPSVDGVHLDYIRRYSKSLVELAVARYEIAMQLPSELAFASICCALRDLEASTSNDAIAIIHYLQIASGLDFNSQSSRSLFGKMSHLLQESFSSTRSEEITVVTED